MNDHAVLVAGVGVAALALADMVAALGWTLVVVAAVTGWMLVTTADRHGSP